MGRSELVSGKPGNWTRKPGGPASQKAPVSGQKPSQKAFVQSYAERGPGITRKPGGPASQKAPVSQQKPSR